MIYGALLIGVPVAAAVETTVVKSDVQAVAIVDPLDKYRGAKELTSTELVDLLSAVGFEGKSLKLAWAIVMKESRGHSTSFNNNPATGDLSYGLFQINMIGSLGAERRTKYGLASNAELYDPVTNATIAYKMSAHGKDWSSWRPYNGGSKERGFRKWLKKYPA